MQISNKDTNEELRNGTEPHDESPRVHRRSRKHMRGWVVFLGVMAVLVGVDVALSYLLLTYGGESEAVWSSYYQAKDETIDTVIVGSSYSAHAVDPAALDSELGSKSWMLASPAQSLASSYSAIEAAIEDHHIKRAIIGIGNDTMFEWPWANATIVSTLGKMQGEPLSRQVKDATSLVTNEAYLNNYKSLGVMFPWTMGTADFSPAAIKRNIQKRLTCSNALEASYGELGGWQYQGQGYGNGTTVLDSVTAGNTWGPPTAIYPWNAETETWDPPAENAKLVYLQPNIDELKKIVELCRNNGVTPYVVVVPQEPYFTLSYGTMFAQDKANLEAMVEQCGGHWIDYSMVRASHYSTNTNEWLDAKGHLNFDGAAHYADVLGSDLRRLEAGEDITSDFYTYDQMDELAQTFPGVNVVTAKAAVLSSGSIRVRADAITPPNTEVEYRFDLLDATGNVLYRTDYSADQYSTLPFDSDQQFTVRAYARTKGSDVPYERTADVQINA